MQAITSRVTLPFLSLVLVSPCLAGAQSATAAPAASQTATTSAPRQSGTVKAVTPQDFVLTNAAGQDYAVNLPSTARILLVDPVTHDIKTARTGSPADIAGGDKAIVSGTPGDTGQTLNATRVLLLKSGAIAAMHADEQAAWAHSVGGVVRSVDTSAGTITVGNGQRSTTITTTPNTVVRRYTGASVRFEDAVKSSVAAIQPGDQVQARGQRSPDNSSLAADEIVTGSFSNYAGTVTSVDASAGTVTLKDLSTKKTVTVAVSGQTNLRKLPPGYGRAQGSVSGSQASAGTAGSASQGGGSGQTASARPERQGAPGETAAGAAGGRGARLDLSRAIGHFPTETLSDLKQGDAVMIVASNGTDGGNSTAITLLSGVEQLLSGTSAGQTTLAPWSLGGGEAEGETGGGSGGGGR